MSDETAPDPAKLMDALAEFVPGGSAGPNRITAAVACMEFTDMETGECFYTAIRDKDGLWWKHRGLLAGCVLDMEAKWREMDGD